MFKKILKKLRIICLLLIAKSMFFNKNLELTKNRIQRSLSKKKYKRYQSLGLQMGQVQHQILVYEENEKESENFPFLCYGIEDEIRPKKSLLEIKKRVMSRNLISKKIKSVNKKNQTNEFNTIKRIRLNSKKNKGIKGRTEKLKNFTTINKIKIERKDIKIVKKEFYFENKINNKKNQLFKKNIKKVDLIVKKDLNFWKPKCKKFKIGLESLKKKDKIKQLYLKFQLIMIRKQKNYYREYSLKFSNQHSKEERIRKQSLQKLDSQLDTARIFQDVFKNKNSYNYIEKKKIKMDYPYEILQELTKISLFLESLNYCFSLTSFNISFRREELWSSLNLVLLLSITCFKFFSFLLFLLQSNINYKIQKYVIKERNLRKQIKFSKTWFFFDLICIGIHPLFFLRGYQSTTIEKYYDNDLELYINYNRPVNHYLYIIQFLYFFLFLIRKIPIINKYNSLLYKRICSDLDVIHDNYFVYRCILAENGLLFTITNVIFQIFFFTTVISVTELGYYLSLTEDGFDTLEEYKIVKEYSYGMTTLLNIFYNIIITMSTIGFGDYYVQDGLSRIFIFIISILAYSIFPLFVVSLQQVLQNTRQENMSIQLLNMVRTKRRMQNDAAFIIQYAYKYYKARVKFENAKTLYRRYKAIKKQYKYFKIIQIHLRNFNQNKAYYIGFYSRTNLDEANHVVKYIKRKLRALNKFIFPNIFYSDQL